MVGDKYYIQYSNIQLLALPSVFFSHIHNLLPTKLTLLIFSELFISYLGSMFLIFSQILNCLLNQIYMQTLQQKIMQTKINKPLLTPKNRLSPQFSSTSKQVSPFSQAQNQFLPFSHEDKFSIQNKQFSIKQNQNSKEPVLATVYINMGEDRQRPVLTLKRSTDVHSLIQRFIHQYKLPIQAYDLIFNKVEQSLNRQGIDVNLLGKQNICRQNEKINESSAQRNNKLRKNNMNNYAENQHQKRNKDFMVDHQNQGQIQANSFMNNKRKKSISPIRIVPQNNLMQRPKSPHPTKICFPKTRTPLRSRNSTFNKNTSQIESASKTSRESQANKPRIPHKSKENQNINHIQKDMLKKLDNLYEILTQNQPKNIQTLCPEYINFDGIGPQTLTLLQEFFQTVHEKQFNYMTKNYFINKMIELGTISKITKTLSQPLQNMGE